MPRSALTASTGCRTVKTDQLKSHINPHWMSLYGPLIKSKDPGNHNAKFGLTRNVPSRKQFRNALSFFPLALIGKSENRYRTKIFIFFENRFSKSHYTKKTVSNDFWNDFQKTMKRETIKPFPLAQIGKRKTVNRTKNLSGNEKTWKALQILNKTAFTGKRYRIRE